MSSEPSGRTPDLAPVGGSSCRSGSQHNSGEEQEPGVSPHTPVYGRMAPSRSAAMSHRPSAPLRSARMNIPLSEARVSGP